MPRPLFVYGTLRDPDVLRLVIGRPGAAGGSAVAPQHRIVFFPGRTYPAIIAADDAVAEGMVLDDLSDAEFELLDRFEGEEYRRQSIEIIVNGARGAADVYWPSLPIPVGAEAWRLEDWVVRHKAAFLAAEGRNLIELRQKLSALRR